ncbi:MAG: FkbM family methyltransferase [Chthoniobacterales bacterium]
MKAFVRQWLDRYFIKQPQVRQFVTRTLERDEDLDVTLFGTRLHINSVKEHGYLRASRKLGSHSALHDEAGVLVTLALLLGPGDTFVDVGANVGLFVCTLARRRSLPGDVRFYAFEANPDTFRRLAASASDLDVTVQQAAISDHAGELEFLTGAVSHVFAESSNRNDYHFSKQTPLRVKAQRLDHSRIEGNSIVVKIDVEGQELNVLAGATGLFEQDRVKAVYLDGYKDEQVAGFLRERGFSFFDGRTLRPAEPPIFSLLAVKLPKC